MPRRSPSRSAEVVRAVAEPNPRRFSMKNDVVRLLPGLVPDGLTAIRRAQQQDFSKVEIKAIPVAGNVYMLEGAGGNIGVSVGSDGVLIVDDQFAPLADKIRAALKGIGRRQAQVRPQHPLARRPHRRQRRPSAARRRSSPRRTCASGCSAEQHVMRQHHRRRRRAEALPVITFDESLSVHFNGEEINVDPLPARPHRRRQRHLLHRLERGPHGRRLLQRPLPVRRPGRAAAASRG